MPDLISGSPMSDLPISKASPSLIAFRARYRGRPNVWESHTPFGFFDDGYNEGRHAEHVANGYWMPDCRLCDGPTDAQR